MAARASSADSAGTISGDDIAVQEQGEQQDDPAAGQANSREALFNCVNILLGCGVLSIPYALEEGGWAAFGVLALMWASTNYTGAQRHRARSANAAYMRALWRDLSASLCNGILLREAARRRQWVLGPSSD